jgi:hypothetical protein
MKLHRRKRVVSCQRSVVSDSTMGPGDETPSSGRACGIFRYSRFRGFSGWSRLALGQNQGGSHCGTSLISRSEPKPRFTAAIMAHLI